MATEGFVCQGDEKHCAQCPWVFRCDYRKIEAVISTVQPLRLGQGIVGVLLGTEEVVTTSGVEFIKHLKVVPGSGYIDRAIVETQHSTYIVNVQPWWVQ